VLVARALQYGIPDPWDQTLGELTCSLDGAATREREQARGQVACSWLGAWLSRLEKMPDLRIVLGDLTPEQLHQQTLEEERATFQELAGVIKPPGTVA